MRTLPVSYRRLPFRAEEEEEEEEEEGSGRLLFSHSQFGVGETQYEPPSGPGISEGEILHRAAPPLHLFAPQLTENLGVVPDSALEASENLGWAFNFDLDMLLA